MGPPISRRNLLWLSAALVASRRAAWAAPQAAAAESTTALPSLDPAWQPLFFDREQSESVAWLAETILPRTGTPGAIDARVHELVDLELSLAEDDEKERFLEGLAWVEARSRSRFGKGVAEASAEERVRLLSEISDAVEEPSAELETGVAFFGDLKRRTIFGYYTSEVGHTQGLGLPEAVTMETFRGCAHRDGGHA